MLKVSGDVDAKMRKVLIVSSSIFPKRSGSAIVIENLVRHFDATEVAVLGELGPLQQPAQRSPESPKFFHFRSRFSLGGRGARFLNIFRWRLLGRLVRTICNAARRENCNYVLGVYPDELFCYAAYLAANELQVPFSCYLHNTYLDNTAINAARAATIQPQLFDRSEHVFVMSEGMRQYFAERYGLAKFVPLVHTFGDYPPTEPTNYEFPAASKAKIVLFGNFNESNIDATRRFVQTALATSDFEVHLYSDVPQWLLAQRGLPMDAIQFHGSLSHLSFVDLIAELRKFDLIALTHGFTGDYGDVEYRTIFPTRTIPMLLCGRPIVVHSPPDSFLTSFFRKHAAGSVVDLASPSELEKALSQLRGEAEFRKCLIENAIKAAAQFHGKNVANVFRERLKIGSIASVQKK